MRPPGRPSKARLETMTRATTADYDKLLKAVVEALLNGKKDVILRTSRLTKFPEDFPKGIRFKCEVESNLYRAKAHKLLNWLREHGYTELTLASLGTCSATHTRLEKEILNGFA